MKWPLARMTLFSTDVWHPAWAVAGGYAFAKLCGMDVAKIRPCGETWALIGASHYLETKALG